MSVPMRHCKWSNSRPATLPIAFESHSTAALTANGSSRCRLRPYTCEAACTLALASQFNRLMASSLEKPVDSIAASDPRAIGSRRAALDQLQSVLVGTCTCRAPRIRWPIPLIFRIRPDGAQGGRRRKARDGLSRVFRARGPGVRCTDARSATASLSPLRSSSGTRRGRAPSSCGASPRAAF